MTEARRTSITLDADTEEVIKTMMRYHMAESFSEYLRGLVMLDFLLVKGRAEYKSLPGWLLRNYPLTFLSEARAMMVKEWAEKMTPVFSKRLRARVQKLIKDGKVDLTTKEIPEFFNEISETESMADEEGNTKNQ